MRFDKLSFFKRWDTFHHEHNLLILIRDNIFKGMFFHQNKNINYIHNFT